MNSDAMRGVLRLLSGVALDGEDCPEGCVCGTPDEGHEVSNDAAYDLLSAAVTLAREAVKEREYPEPKWDGKRIMCPTCEERDSIERSDHRVMRYRYAGVNGGIPQFEWYTDGEEFDERYYCSVCGQEVSIANGEII